MTNVIGFYDDPSQAEKAVNNLIEAGIFDFDLMGEVSARDRNLDDELCSFGIDRHSAHLCAEAVRQGKVLINARPALERADEALQILERHGARELEAGEVRRAEQPSAGEQGQEGEQSVQEQKAQAEETAQEPPPQQVQGEEGQQQGEVSSGEGQPRPSESGEEKGTP